MIQAMDIYNAIGEEIEKYQSELNELKSLIAYADSNDVPGLRDIANARRDLISGLDLARCIAFRHVMAEKESV